MVVLAYSKSGNFLITPRTSNGVYMTSGNFKFIPEKLTRILSSAIKGTALLLLSTTP